jgi:hypothetical protein
MRDLIKHIIKEETNKSVKLIRKYYDIEGDGAYYRGENKIQTLVTLFPKDYDDEMTMGYIGNTEELEEYLEDMHRVEAKKFILRLKKR